MEGSESEAVFGAFDLNPQLFLNEVLNAVDGKSDSAFELCLQQAKEIVCSGADRSEELARGVSSLQYLIKGVLDKRMSMWEKYCLQTCFSVPDGFVLPNSKESVVMLLRECCPDDELDSEIYSLRSKLAAAGREFNELRREISLLEQKSTASKNFNTAVAEVQHILEEPSVHQMFQELAETASKLQKKVAEMHRERSNNMKMPSFSSQVNHMALPYKGLPANIEDVQEIGQDTGRSSRSARPSRDLLRATGHQPRAGVHRRVLLAGQSLFPVGDHADGPWTSRFGVESF